MLPAMWRLCLTLSASDPLLPNNSTANRRSNRRIEIFIVPNKMMLEMAKSNKLQ